VFRANVLIIALNRVLRRARLQFHLTLMILLLKISSSCNLPGINSKGFEFTGVSQRKPKGCKRSESGFEQVRRPPWETSQ
jgi:hypothetical protein